MHRVVQIHDDGEQIRLGALHGRCPDLIVAAIQQPVDVAQDAAGVARGTVGGGIHLVVAADDRIERAMGRVEITSVADDLRVLDVDDLGTHRFDVGERGECRLVVVVGG